MPLGANEQYKGLSVVRCDVHCFAQGDFTVLSAPSPPGVSRGAQCTGGKPGPKLLDAALGVVVVFMLQVSHSQVWLKVIIVTIFGEGSMETCAVVLLNARWLIHSGRYQIFVIVVIAVAACNIKERAHPCSSVMSEPCSDVDDHCLRNQRATLGVNFQAMGTLDDE